MSRNSALFDKLIAKYGADSLAKYVLKDAGNEIGKTAVNEIKLSLARGVSPVQGAGRLVKYSDSYIEQMGSGKLSSKKQRPVNLKLTGKMIDSLHYILERRSIIIRFEDFKAYIHTVMGAGKSKVIRKALPQGDEAFTGTIKNKLIKIVKESLNKLIK